jgi:hypothetical protein
MSPSLFTFVTTLLIAVAAFEFWITQTILADAYFERTCAMKLTYLSMKC